MHREFVIVLVAVAGIACAQEAGKVAFIYKCCHIYIVFKKEDIVEPFVEAAPAMNLLKFYEKVDKIRLGGTGEEMEEFCRANFDDNVFYSPVGEHHHGIDATVKIWRGFVFGGIQIARTVIHARQYGDTYITAVKYVATNPDGTPSGSGR